MTSKKSNYQIFKAILFANVDISADAHIFHFFFWFFAFRQRRTLERLQDHDHQDDSQAVCGSGTRLNKVCVRSDVFGSVNFLVLMPVETIVLR